MGNILGMIRMNKATMICMVGAGLFLILASFSGLAANACGAGQPDTIRDPGIKENVTEVDGVEYKVVIDDGFGYMKVEAPDMEVKILVKDYELDTMKIETDCMEISSEIGNELDTLAIDSKLDLSPVDLDAYFLTTLNEASTYFELDTIWQYLNLDTLLGYLGVDDVLSIIDGSIVTMGGGGGDPGQPY